MRIAATAPALAEPVSLGRLLLDAGKLTQAALDRAERLQAESGERLDAILTKLGLVSELDLAATLSAQLAIPLASARDFPEAPILEGKLTAKFLKQSRAIPLSESEHGVVVAMADPLDTYVLDAIRHVARKNVLPRVALPADLEAAFERLYGDGALPSRPLDRYEDGADAAQEEDSERLKDLASEAPVIRLVNRWINSAVEAGASDIHIEPLEHALKVRFRIDGVLRDIDEPASQLRAAVVSRLKVMAKLNIAERRLAQDGRIRLAVRGKDIDIRVSIIPTVHGESVVLRILDRGGVRLDFAALGFDAQVLPRYLDALERPHGILLVTGPTGSGKTTTLYTSLLRLHTPDIKILTVEDPVEYQLPGVNQTQVKPQIGLSFATILRSFLRHDPDVIMVGEIRDLETARIAVQAALTGHLVLSTLHTNDSASSISRLIDMGVEEFLLTATINGIVAQRLVRTLCPHCRAPYEVTPELAAKLQIDAPFGAPAQLYRPVGCAQCNHSGYRGRTTILEVLPMSAAIRALIMRRAQAREIQDAAVAEGMETMYRYGLRKCLAGQTSVEEVIRVTRSV